MTRKYLGILILLVGAAVGLYPLLTIAAGTVQQHNLRKDFSRMQVSAKAGGGPQEPAPNNGDFFPARIFIPKIGLNQIALHGTSGDVLANGPGHYDETVDPGEPGLSAIAGHRVTFSHPFLRLDELSEGDTILLDSLNRGKLTFKVTGRERVDAAQKLDLKKYKGRLLALTTCDPKFSATYRLIVYAKQNSGPTKQAAPAP